jgi:hypothetical protein
VSEAPGAILEAAVPVEDVRQSVLRTLAASIQEAARIAPRAWNVSLPKDKRRLCLSVGRTEVFVLFDEGGFFVATGGSGSIELPAGVSARAAHYADLGGCEIIEGPVATLMVVLERMRERHFGAIRMAGTTSKGRSRAGGLHVRYHRPDLIEYLREAVPAPNLPNPDGEWPWSAR